MESSRDSYGHPDLGLALRTLRRRVRMTQKQVAEAVSARGVRLSTIWYARLEREPEARPSRTTLGAILEVLGSTWEELETLLDEAEAVEAEAQRAADETWSAPVESAAGFRALARAASSAGPEPSGRPSPLVELVTIWDSLSDGDRAVLLAFARSLGA